MFYSLFPALPWALGCAGHAGGLRRRDLYNGVTTEESGSFTGTFSYLKATVAVWSPSTYPGLAVLVIC